MTSKDQFPERPCMTAYLPWEGKSGLWYFERDFPFFSARGNGIIPAGFETDFGSVPPYLRSVVDDNDPHANCPFVRHDKRYHDGIGERAVWDDELYEGCVACGMPKWKAWLVRQAVRVGGSSRYKKKLSP